MHGNPAVLLVAPLEQRRLDHPAERPRDRRGSARAVRPGRGADRRAPRWPGPPGRRRCRRGRRRRRRSRSTTPASSSGVRNFSTGERTEPSGSTAIHTSPAAPRPLASSISSSSSLREERPRARRGQRLDRPAVAEHLGERVESRGREDRRRGRRAPCRSAGRACRSRSAPSSRAYVRRGNGIGTSTPAISRTIRA